MKKIFFMILFFGLGFPIYAFGSAREVADQAKSYLKAKFASEGDVLKTSMPNAVSYMKARYGSPSATTQFYTEWILKSGGADCAKIRFSGHNNQVNITQVLGPCNMVD